MQFSQVVIGTDQLQSFFVDGSGKEISLRLVVVELAQAFQL